MSEAGIAFPSPSAKAAAKDSLFFVSLPKSGTVFTWNMLEKATGLEIPRFHELEGWGDYTTGLDFACPDLYACGDYNTQMLRPEQMHHYMKGFIFGAHMQASYHNMRVLKDSGVDKISVLLRDPRDAFVSWVHHLAKLGPSARDYHSKIYSLPRDYYDWSLRQQFDYQVRTFLPITTNWIEGWLGYFAKPDREIDVLFVYYDELKRAPHSYIARILEFHGFEGADLSEVTGPKPGEMHFRKGEHGQWREEFSDVEIALAAELMQDRIQSEFEAAAASHAAWPTAEAKQSSGDLVGAAEALLQVLRQFPNDHRTYARLWEITRAAGVDPAECAALCESELGDSIESQFIYRDALIESCEMLVARMSG